MFFERNRVGGTIDYPWAGGSHRGGAGEWPAEARGPAQPELPRQRHPRGQWQGPGGMGCRPGARQSLQRKGRERGRGEQRVRVEVGRGESQ